MTIHEVARDGDRIYLVSDLIEGESLAFRNVHQPVTIAEAVRLTETIARASGHVHGCGIVHRDLKPQNILLDKAGKPHVADFGLARRDQGDLTLTLDGDVLGTPAYMSPEQARGDSKRVDGRSDIYSLGVVLFEMLTGELPFRGQPHAVFDQIVNDEPPDPRRLNPAVPPDLATISLRCLEKQPEKRFTLATDLADELARFRNGEPILSRPVSFLERAWRWSRRNPFAAGLIGLVCAISIIAPLFAMLYRANAISAREAQIASEISARQKSELLYSSQMSSVQRAMEQADFRRVGQLLDQQIPAPGGPDLRDFEWYYWQNRRNRGLLWERTIPRPESLAISPNGQWLAIGSATGFASVEHCADRAVVRSSNGNEFQRPAVRRPLRRACFRQPHAGGGNRWWLCGGL